MSKSYSFILFATIIIGIFIGWSLKPDKKCPEIAGTTIEYVEVPVKHDSLVYKPVVEWKTQKVNIDSIYQVAKKYWEQFYDNNIPVDFIAETDSTLNDSLLSGKIGFVSRIPIDPNGYFRTDLKIKERIVTNNFIEEKEIVYKDSWGVGFGAVIHLQDSLTANLFGNISYKVMNFKHFELPITLEIEFDDNLSIANKTIKAEGRFKF